MVLKGGVSNPHGFLQYPRVRRSSKDGGKKKARRRGETPSTGLEKCWLPKCNSMRTRPGAVEPEVWFRVVHATQVGHNGAPVVAYREQTVEIALGPKGAFESSNIDSLKLRAPPSRAVSTVPPVRQNPKPAREPKPPRVVELLRKAIEWKALIESGKIATQAEIARKEGITRARVTPIMSMLRLTPEIQEQIRALPDTFGPSTVSERKLRPIGAIAGQSDQLREFHEFLRQGPKRW